MIMNRNLAAAALAAVLLPAGAFDAAAAPGMVTQFGSNYRLNCAVDKSDGTALKVRIMVRNRSWRIIKQGARIELSILASNGFWITKTEVAYRNVYPKDSIGFDQPEGARRCTAWVKLLPDVQASIKVRR